MGEAPASSASVENRLARPMQSPLVAARRDFLAGNDPNSGVSEGTRTLPRGARARNISVEGSHERGISSGDGSDTGGDGRLREPPSAVGPRGDKDATRPSRRTSTSLAGRPRSRAERPTSTSTPTGRCTRSLRPPPGGGEAPPDEAHEESPAPAPSHAMRFISEWAALGTSGPVRSALRMRGGLFYCGAARAPRARRLSPQLVARCRPGSAAYAAGSQNTRRAALRSVEVDVGGVDLFPLMVESAPRSYLLAPLRRSADACMQPGR